MAGSGRSSHRSMVIKVSARGGHAGGRRSAVAFGTWFGPTTVYHATFTDASRLKAGQIFASPVPVGSVKAVTQPRPQHG